MDTVDPEIEVAGPLMERPGSSRTRSVRGFGMLMLMLMLKRNSSAWHVVSQAQFKQVAMGSKLALDRCILVGLELPSDPAL